MYLKRGQVIVQLIADKCYYIKIVQYKHKTFYSMRVYEINTLNL